MASSSEKWGTKSRGLLGVVQVEGEEPCELKQSERGPLMRLQEPGQLSCLVLCWGCTRCWWRTWQGSGIVGRHPPHGWGPVEGPPGRGSLLDAEPLALCTGLRAEVDCSAGADSVVDSRLYSRWKGPWTPKAWLCLCGTARSA